MIHNLGLASKEDKGVFTFLVSLMSKALVDAKLTLATSSKLRSWTQRRLSVALVPGQLWE